MTDGGTLAGGSVPCRSSGKGKAKGATKKAEDRSSGFVRMMRQALRVAAGPTEDDEDDDDGEPFYDMQVASVVPSRSCIRPPCPP